MSERIEAMAAMYKGGRTLQQIGDLFGITRERVRQLIKKKGMTGKDGGVRIASAAGRAERMARLLARREEKAKRIYGVSHQETLALNGGMSLRDPESLATKYRQKKANALRKAHDWDLTFRGYVSAIQESGLDLGCRQFGGALVLRDPAAGFRDGNVLVVPFGWYVQQMRFAEKRAGRKFGRPKKSAIA